MFGWVFVYGLSYGIVLGGVGCCLGGEGFFSTLLA